jgi:hypothetical protein
MVEQQFPLLHNNDSGHAGRLHMISDTQTTKTEYDMTQTFCCSHRYLQNFSITASMSDLVMFPGNEVFKLRHTVEDTQPSSELTISNRTFLKNSNSAMENIVNVLFYKRK